MQVTSEPSVECRPVSHLLVGQRLVIKHSERALGMTTHSPALCYSSWAQSSIGMLQAYASEPQRAESPPTPAVPPVSYFLTKEPVVTSYITPLPQPMPMPGPPVQAPMQQGYPPQGKIQPVGVYMLLLSQASVSMLTLMFAWCQVGMPLCCVTKMKVYQSNAFSSSTASLYEGLL